ncbi:hypothetical protein BJ742DRAFT_894738 [Cladochytrium replicatum]|nr:hypothetical protein BJ742DRAFT_894738 [Cladochytrium replicatum]
MTQENKIALINVNVSVANQNNTDFVVVNEVADPITANVGAALLATYGGGITKFPYYNMSDLLINGRAYIHDFAVPSDNGEYWATIALRIRGGTTDDFAIVVAIPKSQFTQNINASKTRGTTTAVIIACVTSLLGVGLTLIAAWPLKKMTKNMELATKLDFSMLEGGKFDEGSTFLEIRNLQRTFNTMIKAFAGAIKSNKKL